MAKEKMKKSSALKRMVAVENESIFSGVHMMMDDNDINQVGILHIPGFDCLTSRQQETIAGLLENITMRIEQHPDGDSSFYLALAEEEDADAMETVHRVITDLIGTRCTAAVVFSTNPCSDAKD